MQSILECPVCMRIQTDSRYYLCMKGHSICESCYQRNLGAQGRTCPECRGAYHSPPTRNFIAERVIELFTREDESEFLRKCPCGLLGTNNALDEHAEDCQKAAKRPQARTHQVLHSLAELTLGSDSKREGAVRPRASSARLVPAEGDDCPLGCPAAAFPGQSVLEHMSLVHVQCRYSTRGCSFEGSPGAPLDEHERRCNFGSLTCRWCQQEVNLAVLDQHNTRCCPHRSC